jgi:hypothetical protein
MAENVLLAQTSCQPHHPSGYVVGPHPASKHAPDLHLRGIQFGALAFDGPSLFGGCTDRDRLCTISDALPSHGVKPT